MLKFFSVCLFFILTACGFHLQGEMQLAPPLKRLYLKIDAPYGQLGRFLKQYLKMSHVELVSSPQAASTILVILSDNASEQFLGVSATTQTRQYNLKVTVTFQLTDPTGKLLVDTQSLEVTRTLTIQSDQILGPSNEASMLYHQIRRDLARDIMTRIASQEITDLILKNAPPEKKVL
jgi:LPS-assembly lipoprotein